MEGPCLLSLEVVTSLSADQASLRLKSFFLAEGLALVRENSDYMRFEGGGGFVEAGLCPDGDTLKLSIFTREWEYQVKKFLSSLPLI